MADITRIPEYLLLHADHLEAYSVAQKMSWAAHRKPSRLEDISYFLLGIFSINMPLLYGEGEKAFTRLQEEIIRTSPDDSIFAWHPPESGWRTYPGLLATSPDSFSHSSDIWNKRYSMHLAEKRPYHITNKELEWEAFLLKCSPVWALDSFGVDEVYLAPLKCSLQDESACDRGLALLLHLHRGADNVGHLVRNYQTFKKKALVHSKSEIWQRATLAEKDISRGQKEKFTILLQLNASWD